MGSGNNDADTAEEFRLLLTSEKEAFAFIHDKTFRRVSQLVSHGVREQGQPQIRHPWSRKSVKGPCSRAQQSSGLAVLGFKTPSLSCYNRYCSVVALKRSGGKKMKRSFCVLVRLNCNFARQRQEVPVRPIT